MTEDARELTADAGGVALSNLFSTVVVAELAASHRDSLATITDPAERCAREQQLLRTLAHVSREDVRAGRQQIERERWATKKINDKKDADYWREITRETRKPSMVLSYSHPSLNSQALGNECAESLLRNVEPDQSNPPAPVALAQA